MKLRKKAYGDCNMVGRNIERLRKAQGIKQKDFISKMYISYKEATETEYWIKLLTETQYFTKEEGSSLLTDCVELKQILTAILKSAKRSV